MTSFWWIVCWTNGSWECLSLQTDADWWWWCGLMADDWCWHTVGPHQQGFFPDRKKKKKKKKKKTTDKSTWWLMLTHSRPRWHPQSQFHQKPARRFWRLCKKYGKVPVLVPWQRQHNCDSRRLNKLVTHAGCFHMQEHRLKPSVLLTAIHSSKSFLTNCLHRCNFEIVFQDDAEMIFIMTQKAKSELRVPTPTLVNIWRTKAQKLVNENSLTQWKCLKEVLHPNSSQGDTNGSWLITPGVKNPKHVFVLFKTTRKQNYLRQNPFIFDTFDLDGDNTAKCQLAACNTGPVTTRS